MRFASSLFCLLQTAVWAAAQGDLLIDLDYGSFQGAYDSTNNISNWITIPFAAPPTGVNRFRAPQPPNQINGTYNSSQTWPRCPQLAVNGSEDCLYLSVFAKPWSQGDALRPVYIQFFSGGFVQGGGSRASPGPGFAILNVTESNDFVTVYPNYRTNSFGFLAGQAVADDPKSDLNVGLLDQQYALKWIQKYISDFGGDPNQVTIHGTSAGGGSVVSHVIANNGTTDPPLFAHAIADSAFWPKVYQYDDPEPELLYDTLVEAVNCTGDDSLQCLKSLDALTITEATYNITQSYKYSSQQFGWAPVVDGSFLTSTLTGAIEKRQLNGDTFWGGYSTYEGEYFITTGLNSSTTKNGYNNSEASFEKWVGVLFPNFTSSDTERLYEWYPANGSSEMITEYNTTEVRAELIYRDVTLACPSYWIAGLKGALGYKGYLSEYAIPPANHGDDIEWWSSTTDVQTEYPLTYEGFAGPIASIIETGDPNTNKLTPGTQPALPLLNATGQEYAILLDDFETVKLKQLSRRCTFWADAAPNVPV